MLDVHMWMHAIYGRGAIERDRTAVTRPSIGLDLHPSHYEVINKMTKRVYIGDRHCSF